MASLQDIERLPQPQAASPGNCASCGKSIRLPLALRLAGGLFSLIAALLLLTMTLGKLVDPRNPVTGLGLEYCGERVCFRGMLPGQSDWDEALAAIYGEGIRNVKYLRFNSTDGEISIYRYLERAKLGPVMITLSDRNGIPRLVAGDVVNQFGPPCRVEMVIPAYHTALIYPFAYFNVSSSAPHVSPTTRVRSIVLLDPDARSLTLDPCHSSKRGLEGWIYYRQWRGF